MRFGKIILIISVFALFSFGFKSFAFNEQINYQGKLTDKQGIPVPDGGKCLKFRLMDAPSGGNEIWSEEWTGTTEMVTTTKGLFSVMLGKHNSLSNVNFNQTLYLEVQYDPGCDGTFEEVFLPRKILGSSPASFEAKKLLGYDWASPGILGSLTPNEANFTKLTVFATSTLSTTTVFGLFAVNNNQLYLDPQTGNVGIGTTTLNYKLDIAGNLRATDYVRSEQGFCIGGNCITSWGSVVNYWTLSGSYLYPNNLSWNVGIGTDTPSEKLTVAGNILGLGNLTIQGISSLATTTISGSLAVNTNQLYVDPATGRVGIGTSAPVDTLTIQRGTGTLQTGYPSAIHAEHFSDLSGVTRSLGAFVWSEGNPSTTTSASVRGIEGNAIITAGNTQTITGPLYGLLFQALYRGNSPGSISEIYGLRIFAGTQTGSGNATNVYGAHFNVGTYGTATGIVTNAYGVYISDASKAAGSTIINQYGLYVENQTKGASNFAIYSAGGTNYFGGNVGIGTTNPSAKLTISGDLYVSATSTLGSATSTPVIFGGYVMSNIIPYSDNTYTLGAPGYRWANLYVATTTIGSTIVIGTDTFTGSSTTTLSTLAGSLILNPALNVGIGTSAPSFKLDIAGSFRVNYDGTGPGVEFDMNSVTTGTAFKINTTGLTTGNALEIVGPSNTNLLTVGRTNQGAIDFARVTIGGPTKREQLYVYGRIASSWDVFYDDFVGAHAVGGTGAAITADALIHNGLVLDEDGECGWRMNTVSGVSILEARAGDVGPAAGEGCNTGSGGVIGISKNENPVLETRVKTTGTSGHVIRIGFMDGAIGYDTATERANGVFFRKLAADTNWFCVTRAANVETAVNSGIAVSATAFQTLRVEIENVNGGQARFFIDGNEVCGGPITTNIPTVTLGWHLVNGTSDAVADNLQIDYIHVWHDAPPEDSLAATEESSNNFTFDPTYQSDIAEVYLADNPEEMLPGTLVAIDESGVSKVRKTNQVSDPKAIGVVSFSPAMILGYDSGPTVRVTLIGRVLTNVNFENGPIEAGDLLTASSIPGIAMKATKPGRVIGIALESSKKCLPEEIENNRCKILVFVNPHWSLGSLNENSSIIDQLASTMKKVLEKLGLFVENSIAKVEKLFAKEIFVEKIKTSELETEKIKMKDKATGQIYCLWLENGELKKEKGECSEFPLSENFPENTFKENIFSESSFTKENSLQETTNQLDEKTNEKETLNSDLVNQEEQNFKENGE